MSEPRDIEYRRMVSNIFRELSAEDVQQIAYVRLVGKDDITKYSAARPNATSLDLMQALERYGSFSPDNIDGLIEVVKDARRTDLVKRIEAEKHKYTSPCAAAAVKSFRKRLRAGRKKANFSEIPTSSVPTEEHAGRFQESKQSREDRSGGETTHLSRRKQELSEAMKNSSRSGPKSILTPTSAVSEPQSGKKKPLVPPRHHERITQETVVHSGSQQQLVYHKLPTTNISSKPLSTPPPPPPKKPAKAQQQYVKLKETSTDDWGRDSGNWTGSFSETVADWTKHHSKSLPDLSGVSHYQTLGTNEEAEHLYATPQ